MDFDALPDEQKNKLLCYRHNAFPEAKRVYDQALKNGHR